MAIYYLDVKPIGGKNNGSRTAVSAAAYRSGERLVSEKNGIEHNYTNRRGAMGAAAYRSGTELQGHDFTQKIGIVHNEIMLPKHAPEAYRDRATLWNSAEKAEKSSVARTGREIVVALPNEMNPEQQLEVVRDYVQRNFVDKGMCADFSIHSGHIHDKPNEHYPFENLVIRKENPHVHIQLTVRPINNDGTWGEKSKRQYITDKNGKRIKLPSGNWKTRKIELTDWDRTETLIKWRKDWADTVNRKFERLGMDERISHLSLKQQGIDREPTTHMGHKAWNLEKKGKKTEIGDKNRAIMARNIVLFPEKIAVAKPQQPEKSASSSEVTAEYIHEMKENYITVDGKIAEIQQEISSIDRESHIIQAKAEEIDERASDIEICKTQLAELKTQRQKMGIFSSKKAIDEQIKVAERLFEQSDSYFRRTYHISPEEAPAEIRRLEAKMRELERSKKPLQDRLPAMLADRESFKFEYHKQRLLAEISRDRERIMRRWEQLERDVQKDSRRWLRRGSAQTLDILTEQMFQKILKTVSPEQAKAIKAHRARVIELERSRELSPTR